MTEPAVSRLSVYLPGTDPVCFTDEADPGPSAAAANTVAPQTRYLLRPAAPLFDDVLLLPYFFLYDAKKPSAAPSTIHCYHDQHPNQFCVWKRQDDHVSRLHRLTPRAKRAYYLRKLFLTRPARTYSELATVEGKTYYVAGDPPAVPVLQSDLDDVLHPILDLYDYQAACNALGLILHGRERKSRRPPTSSRQPADSGADARPTHDALAQETRGESKPT